jgi:hypothetical protein
MLQYHSGFPAGRLIIAGRQTRNSHWIASRDKRWRQVSGFICGALRPTGEGPMRVRASFCVGRTSYVLRGFFIRSMVRVMRYRDREMRLSSLLETIE